MIPMPEVSLPSSRKPLSAFTLRRLVVAWICLAASFSTHAPAADVFTLGTAQGVAGTPGVMVPLLATHDEPMQGFSVALSFDPTPLDLVAVETGSAVDALLGAAAPDGQFHAGPGELRNRSKREVLAAILSNMASAYIGFGQYEEAQSACEDALRLDPTCATALANYANVLYQRGVDDPGRPGREACAV